ncbi:MAG: site-2 protease family protein [Gammaproteobacteria bacterium]
MQTLNTFQQIIIWALPILFAITLHEAAHGWIALRCGDRTAFQAGRVSINPFRHIDLIGTVIIPLLLFTLGGFIFGWAKPVPINWRNLRHPRRDMALVALAGPLANLLMAFFWAVLTKWGINSENFALIYMGQAGITINLLLMLLNLLPLPPLDGSRILASLLPPPWALKYNQLEPYGFIILLLLLISGVLFSILSPIFSFLHGLITESFNLPYL